jgi:hypothetical protein
MRDVHLLVTGTLAIGEGPYSSGIRKKGLSDQPGNGGKKKVLRGGGRSNDRFLPVVKIYKIFHHDLNNVQPHRGSRSSVIQQPGSLG